MPISFADTSRTKRADEVDGRDYHFISRPQFEQVSVICNKSNQIFDTRNYFHKWCFGKFVETILRKFFEDLA